MTPAEISHNLIRMAQYNLEMLRSGETPDPHRRTNFKTSRDCAHIFFPEWTFRVPAGNVPEEDIIEEWIVQFANWSVRNIPELDITPVGIQQSYEPLIVSWVFPLAGVDRTVTNSIACPSEEIAARFADAISAGHFAEDLRIELDATGKTYVAFYCPTYGKTVEEDLDAIGY